MEADKRAQSMDGGDLVEVRIGEGNWLALASPGN